jgi:flavin reductase (DIM6/NTAB) family NADH-FMN oxidoreductase RutF
MDEEVERVFNSLVGELDYPMLVVTAAAGEQVGGCLVGFATQTSISPPRFAVYLSEKNRTFRLAADAAHLGVHFVSEDDADIVELFGGSSGDEVDKLSRVAWQPGRGGTPLLDRCPNRFVGRILERRPSGDHTSFLLEPVDAHRGEPVDQFPFHRAKRLEPGHEA